MASKPSEEVTSSPVNETTLIVQTSVDLPRSEGRSDRCFDGESDSVKSTQSTKVPFNAPFAALEPPAAISGYEILVSSPSNPNPLTSNESIPTRSADTAETIIIAVGSETFTVAALDPLLLKSEQSSLLDEEDDDNLPPTSWMEDPEPAQETSCCFPCRPT